MSGRHLDGSSPALESTDEGPSSTFTSSRPRNPHRTRTADQYDTAANSRPISAPVSTATSASAVSSPGSGVTRSSIPPHVLSGGSNRLSRRHNRPAIPSAYGGSPAASPTTTANATGTAAAAGGRPQTLYQAVTWKENLDAFHRRLRRGSLSMDASTSEDDIAAASSRAAQSKGHIPSGLRLNQDESSHLLGNDGDSSSIGFAADPGLHNKSAGYGTMNYNQYPHQHVDYVDTKDPTLTGGHPPNPNTPSYHHSTAPGLATPGAATTTATGAANSADPVFPVTLNPALAATKPSSKLGTFSGVFIPCVLSIWGIILFLRFGFIIGQVGVVGTMVMFVVGYLIDVLTTFSLSAISSNGTVRGGGPYYMISRSLGPEFGGSIGLIYFLGTVLAGGMNVLGFVEPLIANFGEATGTVYRVLPEGAIWQFIYGTILLVLCTLICLVGAKLFSKTSLVLAVIIFLSTVSIFVSFALVPAFTIPERNIEYTGFSLETLTDNLWPKFTTDGANGPMFNYQVVFGVLFPACCGILAGASMSGDLENPSRSIPRGTLWAVGSTFVVYSVIVILMGSSIARTTMHTDMNILQDISLSPLFIASGALATSIFATLGSVIGAAKILQAIARDNLLPILSVFSQGTPKTDEPTLAVLLTYVLTQLCLFVPNMNAIAAFVSLSTLLTVAILNLACFLLKVGSAPNFRPRFRFFQWWTAFAGMLLSVAAMSFMDLGKTVLSGLLTAMLFVWIHYWSPPKRWGDVTQSLIYHQVRKYLLRLDSRKDHVKFWRPQILLLVHHPRSEYRLIQFCNHLKKGALYVLGHVIVGDLRDLIGEYRRQQSAWLKFVDVLKIKAFVNISVADSVRIGARNLLLSTGLGGMRPNIVVLGSFNMKRYKRDARGEESDDDDDLRFMPQAVASAMPFALPSTSSSSTTQAKAMHPPAPPRSPSIEASPRHILLNIPTVLPTDSIRAEKAITITDYVSIIEDVLALNKAVAIAYGFDKLELPEDSCRRSARGMFDFGTRTPRRSSSAQARRRRSNRYPGRHHYYHHHHHHRRGSDDESSSDDEGDEQRGGRLGASQLLRRSWQNATKLLQRGIGRRGDGGDDYGKESTSLFYRSCHPSTTTRKSAEQKKTKKKEKKYIDLWPMQMSVVRTVQERRTSREFDSTMDGLGGLGGPYNAHQRHSSSSSNKNAQVPSPPQQDILTNFDTYTMVLQMGCILHMVPHWKENYILRVMVFVEYEQDVAPEQLRLEELLENLRIPAQVKVMCLEGGDSETYLQLVCDDYPEEELEGEQDMMAQEDFDTRHQHQQSTSVASAAAPHQDTVIYYDEPTEALNGLRNLNPQWRQGLSVSPTPEDSATGPQHSPSIVHPTLAAPAPGAGLTAEPSRMDAPYLMTSSSPPVMEASRPPSSLSTSPTPVSRTATTQSLNHRGSIPQMAGTTDSPKGTAGSNPGSASVSPRAGALLHDRGASEGVATAALRFQTAVSPRPRPLSMPGATGGATTSLQRHRSLMVPGSSGGANGGVRTRPRHYSVSTGSGIASGGGGGGGASGITERFGTSAPMSMSMNYRIGVPHPKHFNAQSLPSDSDSESISSDDDEDVEANTATNAMKSNLGGASLGGGGGLYSRSWQSGQDALPMGTTASTSTTMVMPDSQHHDQHSAPRADEGSGGLGGPYQYVPAPRPASQVTPYQQHGTLVEDNPWANSTSSSTAGGATGPTNGVSGSSSSGPPPVRPSSRVGGTSGFTSLEATPEMDEDEEEEESSEEEKEMEQNPRSRGLRPAMPARQPSGLGIQLARQQQEESNRHRGPAATGPGASFSEGYHQGEYGASSGSMGMVDSEPSSRMVSMSMEHDDDIVTGTRTSGEGEGGHSGEMSSATIGSSSGPCGVGGHGEIGLSSPQLSSSSMSSFSRRVNGEPRLQFDHLSPEDQLQIVNELMRVHSSSETTSILFTTVPAPEPGTCLSEESSVAYLENMEILMQDIEIPVLLIHAKSLTVTMTL
ncbi:hypothetical protein BGZ73_005560 [Actinomortierella ambigua]|nr:hypothetical protein BGZ73_005560 [Actinomortierella ambigua]